MRALNSDTLALVVLHGGALCLVALLKVSQAWRTALLAADVNGLWKVLALQRFSRLPLILKHAPEPIDFQRVYKQQHLSENPKNPRANLPKLPPLDRYIFTVEIHAGGHLLGSWGGTLSTGHAVVPMQWDLPPSRLAMIVKYMKERCSQLYSSGYRGSDSCKFFRSVTCNISATRRSDLATLLLYKSSPYNYIDDCFFEVEGHDHLASEPPPSLTCAHWIMVDNHPPGYNLVFGGVHDEYADYFTMGPKIIIGIDDPALSGVCMGFTHATYNSHDELDDEDLRKYLFLAPWPNPE